MNYIYNVNESNYLDKEFQYFHDFHSVYNELPVNILHYTQYSKTKEEQTQLDQRYDTSQIYHREQDSTHCLGLAKRKEITWKSFRESIKHVVVSKTPQVTQIKPYRSNYDVFTNFQTDDTFQKLMNLFTTHSHCVLFATKVDRPRVDGIHIYQVYNYSYTNIIPPLKKDCSHICHNRNCSRCTYVEHSMYNIDRNNCPGFSFYYNGPRFIEMQHVKPINELPIANLEDISNLQTVINSTKYNMAIKAKNLEIRDDKVKLKKKLKELRSKRKRSTPPSFEETKSQTELEELQSLSPTTISQSVYVSNNIERPLVTSRSFMIFQQNEPSNTFSDNISTHNNFLQQLLGQDKCQYYEDVSDVQPNPLTFLTNNDFIHTVHVKSPSNNNYVIGRGTLFHNWFASIHEYVTTPTPYHHLYETLVEYDPTVFIAANHIPNIFDPNKFPPNGIQFSLTNEEIDQHEILENLVKMEKKMKIKDETIYKKRKKNSGKASSSKQDSEQNSDQESNNSENEDSSSDSDYDPKKNNAKLAKKSTKKCKRKR